mmetsp:Transcript_3736/g.8215  ORF Transcript_3736/g.8215 Transcript_3736/m.8215 type:complete len:589 (-) Transcript_3736:261-2027(-)
MPHRLRAATRMCVKQPGLRPAGAPRRPIVRPAVVPGRRGRPAGPAAAPRRLVIRPGPPSGSSMGAEDGSVRRVVHAVLHQRRQPLGEVGLAELGLGHEALPQPLLDHRHRHVARHLADAVDVGEGAALGDLLGGHRVGARLGGEEEHAVRDARHARHRRRQPDAGEDVHVVALGGDHGAAVRQRHRQERAARRHHGAAVGPAVGLLGGALGLGRGVAHGHDDGRLVDLGHAADDGLVEELGDGGEAQQHVGPERLHRLLERHAVGHGVVEPDALDIRQTPLVVRVAVAAVGLAEGALGGADGEAGHGLLASEARGDHAVDDLQAHAQARRAGPGAHDAGVPDIAAGVAQRGEQPAQRHRAGPLDVVVEHAVLVAVALEEGHGLAGLEVLELHDDVGPPVEHRVHELVHHLVVLGAGEAALAGAEVVGGVDEVRVVGADVEGDGEDLVRGDAAAGGVEGELADGDAHAVDAEVAQAQDARAVGDDDDAHVGVGPVVDEGGHEAAVLPGEVHAARAAELMAELLADGADGGSVDQRGELLDVVHEQIEVEGLVPILELLQVHIFRFVVGLFIYLLKYSFGLLFQRVKCGG